MSSDCLIEVGTEELPPRALQSLARDFAALVLQALADSDLAPASVEVFATPRRLALLLRQTPTRQADQMIDKRGPALAAAFDEDGNPSRAALGFAGSCGVEVDQLERRETDKGAWLYFSSTQAGKSLAQLLNEQRPVLMFIFDSDIESERFAHSVQLRNEHLDDLPILLVQGRIEEEQMAAAMELGASDLISSAVSALL